MTATYVENARDILRGELQVAGKGNQETAFEHGYLILAMTKGEHATLSDVHDVWSVVRMVNRPWHADIVPFDVLDSTTRHGIEEYDAPILTAIHKTGKRLAAGGI